MRKKTEARRQTILAVATDVFREMGFQNASMNEIAARLGGSKATLYNYFPSKEAIFVEVAQEVAKAQKQEFISFLEQPFPAVSEDSQQRAGEVFSELQQMSANLSETLHRFGEKFVRFICSPEILAIRRLIVAESGRSEIGRFYYESGPQKGMARIAAFLGDAMSRGLLRDADPTVAAVHLRSLLESEVHERYLLNVEESPSDDRIERAVKNAISVFLRAYGTEK